MRFDMICTKNGTQRVDWTNRHANTPSPLIAVSVLSPVRASEIKPTRAFRWERCAGFVAKFGVSARSGLPIHSANALKMCIDQSKVDMLPRTSHILVPQSRQNARWGVHATQNISATDPHFHREPLRLACERHDPSQAGAIKSQSVFWHSVHPALSPKLNNTRYVVPVFSGAYNQVQTSSTPAGLKKLHQHISFNGKFSVGFLPPDLEKSRALGRLLRFVQMK
jgi:hypothetical protein